VLELRVLGNVDLRNAAGEDLDALLTQPKRLALLAYLAAATPAGFHRRDKLLALFWPELDQEHARASLRKAVYVVRRALGEDVLVSRGDEELGVPPGRLWCDAVAFSEAVERGELARALELYRGDLLEGFFVPAAAEFDRWLDGERQRLREAASTAAWALAERFETGEELTHAARWLRRAVRLAPDDERRARKAMRMLAAMGEKAGAIRLYEEFARRMAAEHEAEPAAETQTLMRAIREGEFPPRKDGVA
jgi:DNA-binding SARP family transcriptional activator